MVTRGKGPKTGANGNPQAMNMKQGHVTRCPRNRRIRSPLRQGEALRCGLRARVPPFYPKPMLCNPAAIVAVVSGPLLV
jgi:hypothetical protein